MPYLRHVSHLPVVKFDDVEWRHFVHVCDISWLMWHSLIVNRAKTTDRRRLSSAGRHLSRQDYTLAVILLLLPVLGALTGLTRRHPDLFDVITLISIGLVMPALWLAWATYRSASFVRYLDLPRVADSLAAAVRSQWHIETSLRRINDPYPLSVPWTAADDSFTGITDSLVKQWNISPRSASGQYSSPSMVFRDDLTGSGSELAEVLTRLPTRRLVVLGEPGSGKTILMVRLVLDLLGRRSQGGAVPILVSVASWNPMTQDLRDWLAAQLIADHPALSTTSSSYAGYPNQAAALLAGGLILPILDGLDELSPRLRSLAISQINDTWPLREPIVITSRTEEYSKAIRPLVGPEIFIRDAAVIELHPLDISEVGAYLANIGTAEIAVRWQRLLAQLEVQSPLARILSNPQMISLVRRIYSSLPGELNADLPDPAELFDLPDEIAIRRHLLDGFISSSYRGIASGKRISAVSSRYSRGNTEKWLVFIARHLKNRNAPELAWWQLPEALYGGRRMVAILGGLIVGSLLFIAWVTLALARGLIDLPQVGSTVTSIVVLSVSPALVVVWVLWSDDSAEAKTLRLMAQSTYLNPFKNLSNPERQFRESDLSSAISPISTLRKARTAAVFRALAYAYLAIIALITIHLLGGRYTRDAAAVIVLYVVALAAISTVWGKYELAHFLLALRGKLPYRLFNYLAEGHLRGIFSTTGASYQFRSALLQDTLADPARNPEVREKVGDLSRWALGNPEIRDAYVTVGAVQSDIEYAVSSVAADELRSRHSFKIDAEVRQLALERIRLRLNELGRRSLFSKSLKARLAPSLGAVLDPAHIVLTNAMAEVERHAGNVSSASIGISGVRGVGKSTLIRWVCEARNNSRRFPAIGLYVSAPVEYDAREFLIHLYSSLCQLVLSDDRLVNQRSDWKTLMRKHRIGVAAVVLFALGVTETFHVALMRLLQYLGLSHAGFQKSISYVAFVLAALLAVSYIQHLRSDRTGKSIDDEARERMHRLRYQKTETSGRTGEFSGPFGFKIGGSRLRALSENQMTLPDLVADYRVFAAKVINSLQDLAPTNDSATVIRSRLMIGIDEIDRIENAEQAEKFLNDIKAIFGIPSCFYIASLSADALATFERRAISTRTAFDTAFDTMIRMDPLDLRTAREILERRAIGLPYPFMALCHILSGGIPRELMRVARSVFDVRNNGQNINSDEVSCKIIASGVVSRELNSVRQGLLQLAGKLTDAGSAGLVELLDNPQWPTGDLISDMECLSRLTICQEGIAVTQAEIAAATDIYDRLVASTYFFLTVLEVFSSQLDGIVDALVNENTIPSLQLLVKARSLLAANPSLAISHVHKFRIQHSLQNISLSSWLK